MPIIVDTDRIPARWAHVRVQRSSMRHDKVVARHGALRIAFINNMPDPALQDTELQFFNLLSAAAGDVRVSIKLFSLPGILRAGQARAHVTEYYSPLGDLWSARFDAAIVTGTEPRQPNLRNEPYWKALTDVLDWAAQNTASTILSCLAAHASVLHSEGIERHRMAEKCSGVFEIERASRHPLMEGVPHVYRLPHSRWNELRERELKESGYTLLTRSSDAGVDSFVRKTRHSQFLHFQGHPEYGAHTLFKEYRRDVKRFLQGERDEYPSMPRGYFNAVAREMLERFQATAQKERCAEVMDQFPLAAVEQTLERAWDSTSQRIYMNWLKYLHANKVEPQKLAPVSRLSATAELAHRKHSAVS